MKDRKHRGQSLIELALIMPVLIVLLVVLTDLGRSIAAHVAMANAAREGARYGAMDPDDITGIKNRVLLEYNNSGIVVTGMELRSENILISYPNGSWDPGFPVRVQVRCRFPLFFGSFFPESMVDENGTIQLEQLAEMVIQ